MSGAVDVGLLDDLFDDIASYVLVRARLRGLTRADSPGSLGRSVRFVEEGEELGGEGIRGLFGHVVA
jgi:hypothetical protein